MPLSERNRLLRAVCFWSIIPGLAFLIPAGVEGRNALPLVSIIPLCLSAMIALYHLSNIPINKFVSVVADLFAGLFLLGLLIPTCITLSDTWRSEVQMIGAYGTVPMMVQIVIHGYILICETNAFQVLFMGLDTLMSSPKCPHCQHKILRTEWSMPASSGHGSPAGSGTKIKYATVPSEYDENEAENQTTTAAAEPEMTRYDDPRPSTDDETARMV